MCCDPAWVHIMYCVVIQHACTCMCVHMHTHVTKKSCTKTILLLGVPSDTFYPISSSSLKSASHDPLHEFPNPLMGHHSNWKIGLEGLLDWWGAVLLSALFYRWGNGLRELQTCYLLKHWECSQGKKQTIGSQNGPWDIYIVGKQAWFGWMKPFVWRRHAPHWLTVAVLVKDLITECTEVNLAVG